LGRHYRELPKRSKPPLVDLIAILLFAKGPHDVILNVDLNPTHRRMTISIHHNHQTSLEQAFQNAA
jgi:hypothetical protein